ncbi:MAG TPA: hypothetical protein VKT25_15500, partial [Ktedonobacteraceae bacterium]|nr:hypothetical protein [Ktedonobacteraceae bacterium]
TLLIRLNTLWFGLAIGVVSLLLYQATQHTDIFIEQEEQGEQGKQRKQDARPGDDPGGLPTPESRPDQQAEKAAALSSTGEL